MSELADKYGTSEESIKMMVRDGVISTSWTGCEEIYIHFKRNLAKAKSKTEAVNLTADERNISTTWVHKSIQRFE